MWLVHLLLTWCHAVQGKEPLKVLWRKPISDVMDHSSINHTVYGFPNWDTKLIPSNLFHLMSSAVEVGIFTIQANVQLKLRTNGQF